MENLFGWNDSTYKDSVNKTFEGASCRTKKFSVTERICMKNKCTIHSSAKAKSKNRERNGVSFLQVDQELLKQVQDDVKKMSSIRTFAKEKKSITIKTVHFPL